MVLVQNQGQFTLQLQNILTVTPYLIFSPLDTERGWANPITFDWDEL